MKILLSILALINGGFMLIDGIYVIVNGKYIGPEKPGPWAYIFSALGVNVFKLGPMFIVYGVLWLFWLYGIWTGKAWYFHFGIIISTLTLWYLPVGTLLSIVVLILLIYYK